LWISLGLALLTRNPDGLLAFPLVFAAYLTQVHFEERDDLRVTFGEQYDVYRQTTGVFGPVRIWAAILVAVLVLVVLA
jgi:protein-S-isoprenylcysteine O-methyltransferase Ste14